MFDYAQPVPLQVEYTNTSYTNHIDSRIMRMVGPIWRLPQSMKVSASDVYVSFP